MPSICENIGNNIVLLGALIAITLASDLTVLEQDLLGNFLQVIAQNLLSMAAATNDCNNIYSSINSTNNNNDSNDNILNTDILERKKF